MSVPLQVLHARIIGVQADCGKAVALIHTVTQSLVPKQTDAVSDCLVTACCGPCELCQGSREIDIRQGKRSDTSVLPERATFSNVRFCLG